MVEVLNGSFAVDFGLRTEFPESGMSASWSEDSSVPAMESRGGFDADFSPSPEQKYICPICMLVLKDPMQTRCGHRFCRPCLFQWLSHSSSCPSCKSSVQKSEVFPDNYAKREILGFTILCTNKGSGCDVIMELRAIEKHLSDVCLFVYCVCPQGCSQKILRKDLPSHIENVCPANRSFQCQFCGAIVALPFKQDHLRSCREIQQLCKLCSKTVISSEMEKHLKKSCLSAVIPCRFQQFGCTEQCERQHMKMHTLRNLPDHLEMLATYVLGTDRKFDSRVTSILQNFTLAERDLDAMMICNKFANSQKLRLCAKTTPEFVSDRDENKILDEATIRTHGKKHRSTLSDLKSSEAIEGDDTNKLTVSLEHTVQEQAKKLDECFEYIKRLENTIHSLGTRSSHGLFFWKITDFKRHFQESKASKNSTIYSPGFYSSYYGYKTCLRVHLNGTGSAMGKCLSLFIHFVPGEHDDVLQWPFHGRITLSILDQNCDFKLRSDIRENIEPSPHLEAFEKPKDARNHKGFGYLEFVSLSTLLNASYIKSDTLYITALVDSSVP